jgi:hypothetical protein
MENKPAVSAVPALREERPPLLIMEGDPEAQLEYAQKAADALMKRVEKKPRKIIMGGKQYLEFGDWQTVARFFGATAGTDWSRPVERDGKVIGYEARSVVHQHGNIISQAEAMCLRTERNWARRDEFAIRSMAQTRASAKALRNAFGWVVELAGYASTPAEEMEDDENGQIPGGRAEPTKQLDSEYDPALITGEEADHLASILEKLSATDLKEFLARAQIKKIEDLPAFKYPGACKWLEAKLPDAGKIT